MTGRQWLRAAIDDAAAALARAGIESARADAELLAAHVAGAERGMLTMTGLTGLSGGDFQDRFDRAVAVRVRRVPLQHITGTAAFGPIEVQVGPGVFIPRPETESLLEWALAQPLPRAPVILDVCTGSGALAIALASRLTAARVIAVDDDAAALEYARRNAASSTPAGTVEVVAGDVGDPGLLAELTDSVDLVVANPPYLPDGTPLEPEVACHDPAHALFGGPDGMAVIAAVVARATGWLKSGGLLAIEHDDTAAAATADLLARSFDAVESRRDLCGRPRFVTARRSPRR
ncbi:MAG: peptide chain release factor N(5)-glutamine methyltransferase [Mycobacterium sp.]